MIKIKLGDMEILFKDIKINYIYLVES
jgi:hypothetical protein